MTEQAAANHPTLPITVSSQSIQLSDLPPDILPSIAYYLDQQSAISFARCCKAFVLPAERSIWRTITACVNPHFGKCPYTKPDSDTNNDISYGFHRQEMQRADERHIEGIKAKVKEITMRMNRRRMKRVQELIIESRPECTLEMAHMLSACSPTIHSLDIRGHSCSSDYAEDTLELRLLGTTLSLPFLTFLRIQSYAIHHVDFLAILTNVAPALISLDLDFNNPLSSPDWSESNIIPSYPSFETLANLRYLRCIYNDCNEGDDLAQPLAHLINSAPALQQASVWCDGEGETPLTSMLMEALLTRPFLIDLQWAMEPTDFGRLHRLHGSLGFEMLQRLVLSVGHMSGGDVSMASTHMQEDLPEISSLRIIYYDSDPPAGEPRSFSDLPEPVSTHRMVPDLSHSLPKSPNLCVIRSSTGIVGYGSLTLFDELDVLESKGDYPGFVRSWTHGDDYLLHAKIESQYLDHSDTLRSDLLHSESDVYYPLWYTAEDGSDRERVFRMHSRESWQDLTDYKGFDVPMEILGRMEELEGYGPAERRGRGIKVSDAGWAIVGEWHEAEKIRREGLDGHPGEHTSLH